MRNYELIKEAAGAAAKQWPFVLGRLGIEVPDSPRRHTSCPACDCRASEAEQKTSVQRESQQEEQQRQQKEAAEAQRRRDDFESQYGRLSGQATEGESEYLIGKGLGGFAFPVLPDGSLLLPLVDKCGAVVAAQTITPQGEKRLVRGSAKRGAYHAVNAPESPATMLIAEGLATALSVH
ncbi:MAG: DNA primase, partial [Mixta calida]|nr:DNA primase [Mixta calida]